MPSLPSVYALRERYYQLVVKHLTSTERAPRAALEQIAMQVGLHAEDMVVVLAQLESAGMICEHDTKTRQRYYSLNVDRPVGIAERDPLLRGSGYLPFKPPRSGYHAKKRGGKR